MAYEGYFFEEQIAKFQIQFMAIFEGLIVKTGVRRDGNVHDLPVPIVYGSKDRVTASIIANNTQNALIKIPMMSAYMTGLNISKERMKGTGTTREFTYLPLGGVFPTDIKMVKQVMPVPYDMEMELSIITSNSNQQRQILEQILVYFDPIVQIQKSDALFDMTKITMVELTGIDLREEYPANENPRLITTELKFNLPIWLGVPAEQKKTFVNKVFTKLSILSTNDAFENYITTTLDGFESTNYSSGTANILVEDVSNST